MFGSNCVTACSTFSELRNDSEWYGHRLLPLETSIRKELPSDLITGNHNSFNVLGNSQDINTSSLNTNLSMSPISSEYWQNDNTVDINFTSQTVHERDKISIPVMHSREDIGRELSSQHSFRDLRSTVYDASSEVSASFNCNQTVKRNSQHTRSGPVEIKVEVDPNLYVNCEVSVDGESWSDSHIKNIQCNKANVLLTKTHSKRNIEKNDSNRTSVTSNGFGAVNRQDQIVKCNTVKQPLEDELDEKKSEGSEGESESGLSDQSEDEGEFSSETPQIDESSDIYDFPRNCNAQEQTDLQLSQFYKFECNKCAEKQTFSNFELLTQHCRDWHHTEGCVSCCGQSILEKDQLLKHMLEHKHTYRCAKCQKVFTNKLVWKNHLKEHFPKSDLGPYCCPHCKKQFSSKYGLANHMNLHLPEGERPYKCQHCNKGFGAKHAMTKHERTHLPDEERLSYVCDICGKRFGYASTLDGHQRHVHQNERPFVCHVCAKSFPIKGALTYHLTTHEVQDRVQCSQCGIWLKNEKILRIHKKCHQGELFACPHCDKVSSTRNNLRMHMKRHSDARPHGCPLCTRAFKTPRDLKTHMVQHTGQKPYSCPYCPKTFASPSNFYAHRKMKHKISAVSYEGPPSSSTSHYQY